MTISPDDITPFLIKPRSNVAMQYGQATIVEWNPNTFENIIHWRGTFLKNVDVLAGADALTFRPGDVVGLMGWAPSGGAGSWAVVGKWVRPGTDRGSQSVQFLNTELGSAIASSVFGSNIHSGSIAASETTNSTGWVDLTTVGPSVSATVGSTGKVLIIFSAAISSPANNSGWVGVELFGANVVAPPAQNQFVSLAIGNVAIAGSVSRVSLLDGLNPGETEFMAKYHTTAGLTTTFAERNITIITL